LTFVSFFSLSYNLAEFRVVKKRRNTKNIKMSTTLFDKVWDSHVVRKIEDGPDVFLLIAISFMKLPVLLLWFKRKRHLGFIPRAYFCHCRSQYPNHKTTPVEDPLSANLKALEENSKKWDQPLGLGNKKWNRSRRGS
jgi:3-isopropylmalate/(R)-2-methylmalate dehydratase large subunit